MKPSGVVNLPFKKPSSCTRTPKPKHLNLNPNPRLFSESEIHSSEGMTISRSRNLFILCSLLMGSLFAYSASVQLNDPDWYFWFPLYSCACIVNLTNCIISTKLNRQIAKLAVWLGILLFVKVVVEDCGEGISGFLSLDLSERVVREKTGSLLVIISMILQLRQLQLSASSNEEKGSWHLVNYGMLLVLVFTYPLFFRYKLPKGEMKF